MTSLASGADPAPVAATPVDPVLDRLKRLHPKVIDLSLERMFRLLAALGHPERRLPPVIHVAGTNGKGSTVAFLRAMLEAAGLRVHVYTSPHLVRFHERIRLAGRLIGDDHLLAVLEACEAANAGAPITYFEITTAAALLAFSEVPADAVLLETGMGGRLDATNVVERPAVTAITRISWDHMAYLGDTLAAIAAEKAGIFRPGVPAVLAPQPAAEVRAVLAARAAALGAPVIAHGEAWRVEETAQGFRYESARRRLDLPRPALAGAHQIVNAGVALACLDQFEPAVVDREAVVRGLATVDWPARLQRLTRGPLVERLPAGWELWLDGGHNDSAGEALAAWAARQGGTLGVVFGILATKRPRDVLAPLAPYVARLRAVAIPGEEAALSAEDAAAAARAVGIADSAPAGDLDSALAELAGTPGMPGRLLICGSLYLAGRVLADHG